MIKLKDILKENSGFYTTDPGPKRWFKPYGDKYTEYEKATDHGKKEYKTKPLKEEENPLAEFDGNDKLYDLVRGMSINAYAALEADLAIQPDDANAMTDWIYSLSHTETAAMIRRINKGDFDY